MAIKRLEVPITTDASGAATVYSAPIAGEFIAAVLVPGTLATGADYTLTEFETGAALLTITNGGTSVARWMPRSATHDASGAATGGSGAAPVVGPVKVVVAQGGNTFTGSLYLYFDAP